jgi:hypothetical protein
MGLSPKVKNDPLTESQANEILHMTWLMFGLSEEVWGSVLKKKGCCGGLGFQSVQNSSRSKPAIDRACVFRASLMLSSVKKSLSVRSKMQFMKFMVFPILNV